MEDKTLKEILNPREVPILLFSFFFAQSVNLFTNITSRNVGDIVGLGLNIFLLFLIILGIFLHTGLKKKRHKKIESLTIDSSISSNELKDNYKGLIAFVSDPPRIRVKNEKATEEWVEECKEIIDNSIASGNITEATNIPGIGQTIKAINYHVEKLTHCWLIKSDQSGVNADILEHFFEKITNNSKKLGFVKIDYPNDSKHIKEKIDKIYDNLPDGLKATDIIADITAGNKPMTAGMVLSCLRSDRNLEYVEQSNKRTLIEVDIKPKLVGVEL
jgi:hypothetical protein